jgi:hypothetical protein
MKKAMLVSMVLLLLSLFFVGCVVHQEPVDLELVIDNSSATSLRDGATYAPNSVLELVWKNSEGEELFANVVLLLNGVQVDEALNVTNWTFTVEEEGNYTAVVTAVGARSNTQRVAFAVNRLWSESLSAYNGSSDGLFYTDTFGSLVGAWVLAGHNPFIAFYGLDQNIIANVVPETENVRTRWALADDDTDGVYDRWVQVAAYADQQMPIPTMTHPTYGIMVPEQFVYTETTIEIWTWRILTGQYAGYTLNFGQPILYASVGFDLNWPYTRRLDTFEAETNYTYGQILKLHALYDSGETPLFSLGLPAANESRAPFTVDVTAENVADFGIIYNTRYIQIPVFFDTNIQFMGIAWGNFMPGLKDACTYRLFYDADLDCNVLILYRAFLDGNDEGGVLTTNFATLQFQALDTEEGQIYLSYVDGYGEDITPLFKDIDNKNVDGFILDYATTIVVNGN